MANSLRAASAPTHLRSVKADSPYNPIVSAPRVTDPDGTLEGFSGSEHEDIVIIRRARTGLRAIIAIHSTLLGPSLGGARFYPCRDEALALGDVLRLSRAMTAKAALAGLAHGGGKAVIIGDLNVVKTPSLIVTSLPPSTVSTAVTSRQRMWAPRRMTWISLGRRRHW